MPVRFDPYKSMYVNRHSVEISKVLRDRFVQNYAAQDRLQQKLLETNAAFEGDAERKAIIDQDITARLENFANRGDYENMTLDIAKTAKQYQTQIAPIEQNYQRYVQDKAEKDKMLEEGEISLQTYNNWLRRSQKTIDPNTGDYSSYRGLQFDDNGNVVKTSYYNPTKLARDVDVQGEILAELNKLDKVKSGGHQVKRYQTVDGVEYLITHKDGTVERIPQEAIEMVTAGILNRPDVQSYLAQSNEFRVMDMGVDDMQTAINTKIDQLRAEGSDFALQQANILSEYARSGDPARLRAAAKQVLYNDEVERYTNTAMAANQPSFYGQVDEMKYSERYIEELKNAGLGLNDNVLDFMGRTDNIISPFADPNGEVNPASIMGAVENANSEIAVAIGTLQKIVSSFGEMETAQVLEAIEGMNMEEVKSLTNDAAEVEFLIEAKNIIDTKRSVIQTAERMQDKLYADAEFTSSRFSNQIQARLSTELEISANQLMEKFTSSLPEGTSDEAVMKAIADNMVYAFTNSEVPEGNMVKAVAQIVQDLTGANPDQARAIAAESVNNSALYFGDAVSSIGEEADDILSELSSIAIDMADTSYETYVTSLQESGQSIVNFPRTSFLNSDDKKVAEAVSEGIKELPFATISGITNVSGKSLADLISNKEVEFQQRQRIEDVAIENVYFSRGFTKAGIIEPVVELQLSAGTGSNKEVSPTTVKVPFDQIVPYSNRLSEKVSRAMSTPADKVLNNIMTQVAYAPTLGSSGYIYNYVDAKGNNIEFVFNPRIGANNSILGFTDITAKGNLNGHSIDTIFINEASFHAMYNEMMASL